MSLCLCATTQSGELSRNPAAVPPLQAAPVKTSVSSFSFLFSLTHHLAALTVALKSSPFDFQGEKILSSPDKEAFDWVAVNYVLENFFKVKDNPAWGVQN